MQDYGIRGSSRKLVVIPTMKMFANLWKDHLLILTTVDSHGRCAQSQCLSCSRRQWWMKGAPEQVETGNKANHSKEARRPCFVRSNLHVIANPAKQSFVDKPKVWHRTVYFNFLLKPLFLWVKFLQGRFIARIGFSSMLILFYLEKCLALQAWGRRFTNIVRIMVLP